MKNRNWVWLIILVVIAAAVFFLLRRNRQTEPTQQVPLDLAEVIPADWTVLPEWQIQCNFDGDSDLEWLIVYRYDKTKVPQPHTKDTTIDRGPIGGAIFDTQNNVLPEGVGNPSPYAPTIVIPYRLLPDFYDGKGQGYLGETSVNVLFNPALPDKGKGPCEVDEITVLGYADSPLPTRLSVFHWQDTTTGYVGAHLTGDARVAVDIPVNGAISVAEVTTYNRLQNHRSLLCAMQLYRRKDMQTVVFEEDPSVYSVDFCFGAPPDPAYPEGVVVAYVRGSPQSPRPDASPPPTNGYLLNTTQGVTGIPTGPTTRIFSLTNPASVNRDPAGGHSCTSDEVAGGVSPVALPGPTPTSPPGGGWICGRETATVETEIAFPEQVRRVIWELISIIPGQVNGDVYWRIQSAQITAPP